MAEVVYTDASGRGAIEVEWAGGYIELTPGVPAEIPDGLAFGCEAETETVDGIVYVTRAARIGLVDQHDDIELVED